MCHTNLYIIVVTVAAVCIIAVAALYRRLKRYLLTEDQLVENGFPRSHSSVAGTAVVSIPQQEKSLAVVPSPNCTCSVSCC